MPTNLQIERQLAIEAQYSRKHIDTKLRACIEANPVMLEKIEAGVFLINEYMDKDYSYVTKAGERKEFTSKINRINQLRSLDLPSLVLEIFVGIAYCQAEVLFTSITAQLASRLKFDDKAAAITTVAELVAVLCLTDAFDINKADRSSSLMVISRIPLPADLLLYIENSSYLPPMVCEPLELTNNYSSGYLSFNESLILGSQNHHDGDLCLDVLNTMNRVALKLDTEFLSTVEEDPTFELDSQEKKDQWLSFKKQSYKFYLLLAQYANKFYLCHRVDKRGRIYASGFHVSTQGSAFKKSAIELSTAEVIEVPDIYRI